MRPHPTLTVISLEGRPVLRHGAHGKRRCIRPHPRLRHLRRHPLGAAQHLRAPGVAKGPAELPPVRRGQRTQPPRGREGPHQPFGLTKLRGHSRLPEGRRRGRRRHRQAAVHRQLQDQAHSPKDTRTAGSENPAARPRRNHRRAVARHLHRRGHTHEDLPRQMDDEPLPSHRDGDVPKRLPELVAGALRQAPGTLGPASPAPSSPRQRWVETKRRWRSCSRRRCRSTTGCGTGWRMSKSHTCTPCGCPWLRPSRWTRQRWERRTARRLRERVRGSLWGVRQL